MINFGRSPTKKEKRTYNRWVKYLSDSRLDEKEIHRRAAGLTIDNIKFPK